MKIKKNKDLWENPPTVLSLRRCYLWVCPCKAKNILKLALKFEIFLDLIQWKLLVVRTVLMNYHTFQLHGAVNFEMP
jgi:hypothetical protein